MAQNTTHAVMAQRHEPADSHDDFPTPPWAVRGLCEWLEENFTELYASSCYEPAAGRGHMAAALAEYFERVVASDAFDYGYAPIIDYLSDVEIPSTRWTITNPPFKHAAAFARRALRQSTGVALLCRTSWAESVGRYNDLFRDSPPAFVLTSVERIPMVKGRVDPRASTATSYSWFIWWRGLTDTKHRWLAPCRKRLERSGDEVPPAPLEWSSAP